MFQEQIYAAETRDYAQLVDILLTSRRSPLKVLSQSGNFILEPGTFRELGGFPPLEPGSRFCSVVVFCPPKCPCSGGGQPSVGAAALCH